MGLMTDHDRLDWLERAPHRLHEVHHRMVREGQTIRESIDALAAEQADMDPTPPLRTKRP